MKKPSKKLTASQKSFLVNQVRILKEIAGHEEWIESLKGDLRKLQKSCPHDAGSEFFGDPSGGNDSWERCNLCGGDCR
jgi:hypothetical protein